MQNLKLNSVFVVTFPSLLSPLQVDRVQVLAGRSRAVVTVGAPGQVRDLVSVGHRGGVRRRRRRVVVDVRGDVVVVVVDGTAVAGGVLGRSCVRVILLLLFAAQTQREGKVLRKLAHDLAGRDETAKSFLKC